MMGFAEWVTVLSVTGVIGAVIVACFVYLIRQLMKQNAANATNEYRAKVDAEAVEQIRKVDEIIAERVELNRVAERLRNGNF